MEVSFVFIKIQGKHIEPDGFDVVGFYDTYTLTYSINPTTAVGTGTSVKG